MRRLSFFRSVPLNGLFSALTLVLSLQLVACPTDNGEGAVTLSVAASASKVVANGTNTVDVTVTVTQAGGGTPTGLVILTTSKGSLQGGGRSFSAPAASGTIGPVTLTTCDSDAEADCAGSNRVRATLASATGSAVIEFEPWVREKNCDDGIDDDGDLLVDCADIEDCLEGTVLSNERSCVGGAALCQPKDPAGTAASAETNESSCSDAADNDCDGTVDCDDSDCDQMDCNSTGSKCNAGFCVCSRAGVEGVAGDDCYNSIDDDCDGLVDSEDPDCVGTVCSASGWQWYDDGSGTIACGCPPGGQTTETNCNDGFDNDCDNLPDCQDPDCDGAACTLVSAPTAVGLSCSAAATSCICAGDPLGTGIESDCNDGVDNDCDGLTDCDDTQNCSGATCGPNGLLCSTGPVSSCECPGGAVELNCGDNVDNDCDGQRDCNDADCNSKACGANGLTCASGSCLCPGGQINESNCGDNLDNDCDGARDCADPDCDVLVCNGCGFSNCICDTASSTCAQDPGLNRLTFSSDVNRVIAAFYADSVEAVLTAHVEDNTGPIVGHNVDIVVAGGTLVESGTGSFSGVTNASGDLIVHWRPGTAPAKQLQASATTVSNTVTSATVTKSVAVDVIGLQSITTGVPQYTTMGARDSGWQETSNVAFLVVGTNSVDTGLPIPDGVPVTFSLSNTTAGGLTLTKFTDSTLNGGVVNTTAIAGTQAISFTITATVTIAGVSDSVTTGTINIVGAKPNYQGFTFSCAQKNVNGLGSFPVDSNFTTTNVNVSVACSVNVNDRWNNPVERPGVAVLYTTEGGTINTNKAVINGRSDTTFRTAGTLAFDTTPMPNEPRWTHTDNGVTQIRNPRDGFYTLIAYVSGEEAFTDANGNAVYDLNEQWVDLGEPFVDRDDSGGWDPGEFFFDNNNNQVYEGPNGVWDSDTMIWDETRITVSGCCGNAGVPGLGFQTSFGAIADGGSATSVIRVADINMNPLAGGTPLKLAKVSGSPISKIEFADGSASRTIPDNWGLSWVESQSCTNPSNPLQCVHVSSVLFSSVNAYGYAETTFARDGTPNNAACDLAATPTPKDCSKATDTCVGLICMYDEPFSVRAEAGPCAPNAIYFGDGTVD